MRLHRTTLFVAFVLGIHAATTAQKSQCLRFEVPAGQTATGTTSDNAKSQFGASIGGIGMVSIDVPKGATSKDIVDALVDKLTKEGYKIRRDGDHAFYVEEGPNGTPIEKGGGMGGTDTGVNSLGTKIVPKKNAKKKQNGGIFGKPRAKKKDSKATETGRIQIDVEVEIIQGNTKVRVHVQVVVPVFPGDTQADIEQRVRKELQAKGLSPRSVTVPSNLDAKTQLECFGLDRTLQGDPILGVACTMLLPPEFYWPMECFTGTTPIFGITNEGLGSQARAPWIYGGDPFLGTLWPLFVEVGPRPVIAGIFLSPQRAELEIPRFGPEAWLLVDPMGSILLPMPAPSLGRTQVQLPLPPDPLLGGVDLMFQAVVLDVGTIQFDTTDRLVVRPIPIGR